MTKLDLIKNFAIVSLGVNDFNIQTYGVAFAALRSNPVIFLVATTNTDNTVTILELHKDTLTFIHPSKWEELFTDDKIMNAFRTAYTSSPEDWPCGYVRAEFVGETKKQSSLEVN